MILWVSFQKAFGLVSSSRGNLAWVSLGISEGREGSKSLHGYGSYCDEGCVWCPVRNPSTYTWKTKRITSHCPLAWCDDNQYKTIGQVVRRNVSSICHCVVGAILVALDQDAGLSWCVQDC